MIDGRGGLTTAESRGFASFRLSREALDACSPARLRNLAVASRPMAGDRDVVTPPVVGARQLSNESNCSFGDAESVHDARAWPVFPAESAH